MLKVSPTLSSSTSAVSRTSTQVWFLSPLRLPFRHARIAGFTNSRQICVRQFFSLGFFPPF
jgi:hypothetical protein